MIEKYTALYSDLDIEYSQAMSGPYEDLCYRGDDAVLIAGHKDGRITGFWRPVVAFGDDRKLKMLIEDLWNISQDIYYQDYLVDGKLSVISQFLLRHGYRARPYYTQVIDLTKTEEELHADLRKSYKSLINNNKDNCYIPAMEDHICEYQLLHEKISNGKTRNQQSWSIQQDMILKNEAFLVMWRADLAGGLFYYNQIYCYYASGKSEKNINSHAILWLAIRTAKSMEIKYLEMGEQIFSGDPKLVNISKFKRGFGGRTITRLNLTKD